MHRATFGFAAGLLAFLSTTSLVAAACPYPLGEFAARGNIVVWDWDGEVEDVERAIVEATIIHGQKSFGMIVNAAGQLHFVYNAEVEFELPGGVGESETHSIFYKQFSNATGWDVPIQYLASEDPTVELPDGRNVQPYATALGADLWTVWEVSGATRFRENGSYILLRGKTAAGFTPIQQVSFAEVDAANKLPKILTVGTQTYLAFQSNAQSADKSEYQLFGRPWDGETLGPLENISVGGDGWSDQVVSLSTDGARVFAAWTSQNTSELTADGDWVVKVAVRDAAGVWGPEAPLSLSTKSRADAPSAAWFLDRVFVAWSTNDPTLDARGDYDIVMRSYDPASTFKNPVITLPPLPVSTPEFQGGDITPSIHNWSRGEGGDGLLHIMWASDSSPSSIPTSGNETDIYHGTYDGSALGTVKLVSDPLDNDFTEILPGFFAVGDSLYAYFLSNICLPGCGHETDWREMTRLLERPLHFYDDVRADYSLITKWPSSNASAAVVRFTHADGSLAGADGYFVKTSSGDVLALTLSEASAEIPITHNASALLQLQASYCGKDLPTVEDEVPLPQERPRRSPAGDVVVPSLLAASALAALAARRGRRG